MSPWAKENLQQTPRSICESLASPSAVIDTIQQQALYYKKGSEIKFVVKKSFFISVSLLMNDI